MRIVITGGATGGHVTPLEPIIEALRVVHHEQQSTLPHSLEPQQLQLYFLGVVTEAARTLFAAHDIPVRHIPSGKLRRYASSLTIIDLLFRLPFGIVKALVVMWFLMPDVVISKGGYGSVPVVLAAAFFRIPILLHESDVTPGLANRILGRLASVIAVGFAPAQQEFPAGLQRKIVATGIPVRSTFGRLSSHEAKRSFGLPADELVVLVMGGSQGAQHINEVLLQVLPQLITRAAIIHLTGEAHYQAVTTVAAELLESSSRRDRYKAHPYLTDTIDAAFAAADIIVARAGATTLAEIARLGKASLLIPLPGAANDHQRRNAAMFETAGAARVLEANNLGRNLFERSLEELLTKTELRESLGSRARQFDRPRAARDIAELAFKLAQGLVPV